MSHFTVMVIGENPEKQLEPFNENLEVAPYVEFTLADKAKERIDKIAEYKADSCF